MRLLLDTQILLWVSIVPTALSTEVTALIDDEENELVFSAASLWEVSVKYALDRPDFDVQPWALRTGLLANRYKELAITGDHAIAVARLPALPKDPFDRILVAQAVVEDLLLVTADAVLARYPGPVRRVRRAG